MKHFIYRSESDLRAFLDEYLCRSISGTVCTRIQVSDEGVYVEFIEPEDLHRLTRERIYNAIGAWTSASDTVCSRATEAIIRIVNDHFGG